jgi:hypothetical protein
MAAVRKGLRCPATFGSAPASGRHGRDRSWFAGVGVIWFIAPVSVPDLFGWFIP